MSDENRQAHWDEVYTSKGENAGSWFQENPALSLELIKLAGVTSASAIVDIGGGASRVVDGLIANGFERVTVLEWVTVDVTKWEPSENYDIWHDRAAFHFLTEAADRHRLHAPTQNGTQIRRPHYHWNVCSRRPGAMQWFTSHSL